MREYLDSRSENLSTKAPIEFAENPKRPETATTTSGAGSGAVELGSKKVGENVNEDERRGVGAGTENMGQDVEESNLEFLIIERQI